MATGKGNTFSNDVLKLIFNATTIANIAINATASPLTSLFVSLHTASPGASGTQATNEAAYTGYSSAGRVAVSRDTGGWTASSAQSTSPVASITFGTCTGAPETETYAGIGVAVSGATKLLYFGPLASPIVVTASPAITPSLTTASTVTEA